MNSREDCTSELKIEEWIVTHDNLIHSLIKKYQGYDEYKDLRQEALIGAMKGLRTWDYTKKTLLSTYVYSCMENEIKMHVRKKKAKSRSRYEVSLDSLYESPDKMEDEILKNDTDYIGESAEEVMLDIDTYRNFFAVVTPRLTSLELQCLKLRLKGFTMSEIGKEVRYSQPTVSNMFQLIRDKIGHCLVA